MPFNRSIRRSRTFGIVPEREEGGRNEEKDRVFIIWYSSTNYGSKVNHNYGNYDD